MPGERGSPFKQWLSRPPRPHGAIRFDRRVSFLELFYDLVYVAVIGQASHQLAEHITVRGAVEFAIIFGLIWFAWINGSLYVELHGGEDGRTRNIVFVQMCFLALLAVFTADAADRDGTAFSVVYSAFLLFMTWLWYTVRGQDADRPEFLAVSGRYGAKPLPRSTSARDRSRESPGSGDACSPAWGQPWQLPNQPQPIGDPP